MASIVQVTWEMFRLGGRATTIPGRKTTPRIETLLVDRGAIDHCLLPSAGKWSGLVQC